MLTQTQKTVATVALVFGGLVTAAAWTKAAPTSKDDTAKNCCEQKLACCEKELGCCTASDKPGCCDKSMACCKQAAACCTTAPDCCKEGKPCCDQVKACCTEQDKSAATEVEQADASACCETAER